MNTANHLNQETVREQISTHIDNDREKIVDVESTINSLVNLAKQEIESPESEDTIDAAWRVIEREKPYEDWSHTQRVYALSFLFHNYGVSPAFITEDSRVRHGTTWNDITRTLCEYAFYEVTHALATDVLSPEPHRVGEYNDSRRTSRRLNLDTELNSDPLTNADVHNWIATLASEVSSRLANGHSIPKSERTDVQSNFTDYESTNEDEAIDAVIRDQAHDELYDGNLITAVSFLDALEELYGMTGEESIESEQLEKSINGGTWDDALTTGVLSQAMRTAIHIHRETFSEQFKSSLPE